MLCPDGFLPAISFSRRRRRIINMPIPLRPARLVEVLGRVQALRESL